MQQADLGGARRELDHRWQGEEPGSMLCCMSSLSLL